MEIHGEGKRNEILNILAPVNTLACQVRLLEALPLLLNPVLYIYIYAKLQMHKYFATSFS